MPQTPVFGIRYPCAGVNIDPEAFCEFAADVEAALLSAQVQVELAANRPAAVVGNQSVSAQTFAVNTPTDVTFAEEISDNDGMVDLGVADDQIEIQTAGLYLAFGHGTGGSGFTTRTSMAIYITQNGTIIARDKDAPSANDSNPDLAIGVLLDCQVGDIIRLQYRWTGTGGPLTDLRGTLGVSLEATN